MVENNEEQEEVELETQLDPSTDSGETLGSGGSEVVEGFSQSYEDITRDELLAFPPKAAREDWKVTRFPVSMEEFQQMSIAAQAPEPVEAMSKEEAGAREDSSDDDDEEENGTQETIVEVEAQEGETAPEDDLGVQTESAAPSAAPSMVNSFEGIPATAWRPPDCTIAVGPSDVMLAVNSDLAGYSKSGTQRFRWANMTALFKKVTPSGTKIFDPRVAYDHYAKRWIVVTAATRSSPQSSWFMLAVSQTSNPKGRYWVWRLDATRNGNTPTGNWGDYPMLGFDTQGIYITANMFKFGGGFQYSKLRILKKSEVYSGGSIKWYDFWGMKNSNGSTAFTIQPCIHFRGTGGNPSAYLINALWPSGSSLTLWTLKDPVGYWSGRTPGLSKKSVSCRNYNLPPDAQQKGTTVRIETNDDRLLKAVYQYAGGVRRIWTTHTTKHTWSGDSEARTVVQWYEIDIGSKKVFQQNRYGAKGKYYFFPAIQIDSARNAYVVFGRSSSSLYAQLRFTGRKVTAPKHDLENSRLIKSGESSYTGGRYGDYFDACRDGGNSSKVWMYGEYADSGGAWGTWVAGSKY